MQRIETVQKALSVGEAALITAPQDRLYLTGFPSSAGVVLILPERAVFLIDFRYYEKACQTVRDCEVCLSERQNEQIGDLLTAHTVQTLFVQTEQISLSDFHIYQAAWQNITVSDSNKIDTLLRQMRSIKDDTELAAIRAAQRITDRAFSYILSRIDVGRTERDILLDLEFFMRQNGSEGVAFDSIVVSGPNSSLPHGVPGDRKLAPGDFITMDFGAVSGGYCSDMTRTVALGGITDEKRQVYDTVLQANTAVEAAIRAGQVCKNIDRVARDLIDAAGYSGCFGHGLGHSVGIDIHEPPFCNTKDESILTAGTVMTVEPGIYLAGKFGVRIEDMVVVTDNGCEILTKSPKDLIIL